MAKKDHTGKSPAVASNVVPFPERSFAPDQTFIADLLVDCQHPEQFFELARRCMEILSRAADAGKPDISFAGKTGRDALQAFVNIAGTAHAALGLFLIGDILPREGRAG